MMRATYVLSLDDEADEERLLVLTEPSLPADFHLLTADYARLRRDRDLREVRLITAVQVPFCSQNTFLG